MPAGTKFEYEYASKTIAVAAPDGPTVVIGGTLNIRNPASVPATIARHLAIPGQAKSKVLQDELAPGAAMRVTSQDVLTGFGMKFAGPVEGFLIIQSDTSLDVAVVYAAAPVGGGGAGVRVIHVPERRMSESGGAPRGGTVYEYASKVTSVAAADPWDNIEIGGTLNIRNWLTQATKITKQLVLPGQGLSKELTEEIAAGAAIRISGNDAARTFGMKVKGPIEGFLVIRSSVMLDVVALYTAGPRGGPVTSIDVVHLSPRAITAQPQRRRR